MAARPGSRSSRTAPALPGGRLPWLPMRRARSLLAACTRWPAPRVAGGGDARGARGRGAPRGVARGAGRRGRRRPGSWAVRRVPAAGTSRPATSGRATPSSCAPPVRRADRHRPRPAALERCLALLGIDRIDLLVLTHWDADHVGGVEPSAGRVDTVIHGPPDGERSDRVLDPLVRGGRAGGRGRRGRQGALGDARWRVVWPGTGRAGQRRQRRDRPRRARVSRGVPRRPRRGGPGSGCSPRQPRAGRSREGRPPRLGRPERAALRRAPGDGGRHRGRRRQRLRSSDRSPARPPREAGPPRCAPTGGHGGAHRRRRGRFRLWSERGDVGARP